MIKTKQTTVKCQFGKDAENGDYVLTLHQYGYNGKNSIVLAGRVWDGKVYTGTRISDGTVQKTDIHKLSAILVIDPALLTEKQKADIQVDMCDCIPGFGTAPKTLERYLKVTYFEHINQVWDAFELCRCEEDIETLIDRLKYGWGGKFGDFSYSLKEGGFTVLNTYTSSYNDYDSEEETVDFDWYSDEE